ncbi:MAG: ABC transporter permease [Armatimonadetes bacterium]|nr:ABC transporter permease [Armatimonadota bacterium]
MLRYIGQRVALFIPTTLLLLFLVFALIYLIPGDPVEAMLAEQAGPELIARVRADLGLDQPLHLQFVHWLGKALRGNLGRSIRSEEPVGQALAKRQPGTREQALLATLVAVAIALPAGVISAVRRGQWADSISRIAALLGLSFPSFFLAIVLIYVFALGLRVLPPSGYRPFTEDPLQNLRFMIMPAVCLGMVMAAILSRMTRSSLLEVLGEDYIRTARAKGLSGRMVIYKHALKNALIPVVTIAGIQFGALLGGTVIIETIFALPGIGRLLIDNIRASDFPMVQGVVLFMALARLVINLATDLLYGWLDPRIRYG